MTVEPHCLHPELLYEVATELGVVGSRRVSGTTVATAFWDVVGSEALPCRGVVTRPSVCGHGCQRWVGACIHARK